MENNENKLRLDSDISVKEKFNSLSNKKKLEFILDYYKLPILGIIVAIIIISYTTYSIFTKQDTYCNITYFNSCIDKVKRC